MPSYLWILDKRIFSRCLLYYLIIIIHINVYNAIFKKNTLNYVLYIIIYIFKICNILSENNFNIMICLYGTFLVAHMLKNLPTMQEGLISELGRSSREGNGYPLQYSFLENSTDKGAWQPIVLGLAKSWTQLSD